MLVNQIRKYRRAVGMAAAMAALAGLLTLKYYDERGPSLADRVRAIQERTDQERAARGDPTLTDQMRALRAVRERVARERGRDEDGCINRLWTLMPEGCDVQRGGGRVDEF